MLIIFSIIILLIIIGITLYNSLVKQRQMVNEAYSGIDVQLKKRSNLIPNLVEIVKGYASHEKETLEDVTRLRNQTEGAAQPKARADAENSLTTSLKTLFAVVENYPDLKADKNFQDLHKNLVTIEDDIQMARRYYNGSVRDYNIKIHGFPSNIVAQTFAFKEEEFFEIETSTDRKAPTVDL